MSCYIRLGMYFKLSYVDLSDQSAAKARAVHIKHTSALFSMQIEYWIFTCKVLDPMPAISA